MTKCPQHNGLVRTPLSSAVKAARCMLIVAALLALVAACWLPFAIRQLRRHDEPESLRRRQLFVVEVLLLLVPYTALAILGTVAVVVPSWRFGPADLAQALAFSCLWVVPLLCGWRLSVLYLTKSPDALRASKAPLWWGCYVGAVVPIVGAVALVARLLFGNFAVEPQSAASEDQPFGPLSVEQLALALFVSPLLIPLWHLIRERQRGAL